MGKSLEVSSGGADFDRFMQTLVRVPKAKIDETLCRKKRTKERSTKKSKG